MTDDVDVDGMDAEARAQFQSIIDAMSPAARLEIAGLTRDNVIRLHRGLGTYIRNRIRTNELGALSGWSHGQNAETKSLDDLSWPILVAVWMAVRSSAEVQEVSPLSPTA